MGLAGKHPDSDLSNEENMEQYIKIGDYQKFMAERFYKTGDRMQFNEMINYLAVNHMLLSRIPAQTVPKWDETTSTEDFNKIIDSYYLVVTPSPNTYTVTENAIIPVSRDVFVIRHPRFTRPSSHAHNYFELDYVVNGSCEFYFNGELHRMKAGEMCIIAPGSDHDITINDEDSTVYCIMIRKSTFNTSFFSLLSRKDLLAQFFRTILQDESKENYLQFFTGESRIIENCLRHAFVECNNSDDYSNSCCINWINLMLTELLRNYSKTIQFHDYKMGTDFSLILQYIEHNYQTLTLQSLAEFFHYSEPHLSTLIKQNTGCNFTALIKQLRLSNARNYLLNTNMKISEIADHVGYNSADHFSRVFRNEYKVSPAIYRQENSKTDNFIPFMEE